MARGGGGGGDGVILGGGSWVGGGVGGFGGGGGVANLGDSLVLAGRLSWQKLLQTVNTQEKRLYFRAITVVLASRKNRTEADKTKNIIGASGLPFRTTGGGRVWGVWGGCGGGGGGVGGGGGGGVPP